MARYKCCIIIIIIIIITCYEVPQLVLELVTSSVKTQTGLVILKIEMLLYADSIQFFVHELPNIY